MSHTASSLTTAGNGGSGVFRPAISADGSTVAFDSSAGNLVPGQRRPGGGAGSRHVFLFHRPTGRTSLVDHVASSPTTPAAGEIGPFAVSADGSAVAFTSAARNLVAGQVDPTRQTLDVFVYQRGSGGIVLVSGAGGSAKVTANASSTVQGISADGSRVLFESEAADLVRGVSDGNGKTDLFLHDRRTRKTALVSHTEASDSRTGNGASQDAALSGAVTKVSPETGDSWANPRISANGRIVAFTDQAEPAFRKVVRYDRATGALVTVTERGASGPPLLSADGSVLAFTQAISGLSDSTDAFVYIP